MCQDDMMTTKHLDAIESIDVENRTVTCQTGVSLETLHAALWEKGLVLDTAPALDWVTVGGAISTGSHGSGPASISSSVIGCRLVTSDGDVVEIDEHHGWLDAVRVSLGMLGILSTVTLRVTDAFDVALTRTRIPTQDWKRFLSEGEMSYLLWFPHTDFSVLSTVDVLARGAEVKVPNADGDGVEAADYVRGVEALGNLRPSTFPARNRYLLDVLFPDGEHVGPAHEVLMSFRSDPVAGAEWAVPLASFDDAFAELQELAQRLPLPIVWLKKVEGESAWLGSGVEPRVQCGMYHSLIEGTPSLVKEMVTEVERLMTRHGGRPHFGKLCYLSPADLGPLYPRWDDFHDLRRQVDRHGMFWTEAVAAQFGDR
jgi:FAD/FMN-containing dehydrogenase